MKNIRHQFTISNILLSLCITIVLLSFGIIFTVNFRGLYYWNVGQLNLPAKSGLSKKIILENYNALIDYCSPFYTGSLNFPSFGQSISAAIHFAEVKNIFNIFFALGITCLIPLLGLIPLQPKRNRYSILLFSACFSFIIPAVFLLASVISFDKTFILFHKLVFQNNYWIFNAETDPVITILPKEFFLQCGILIALIQIAGSIIFYLLYRRYLKKEYYSMI